MTKEYYKKLIDKYFEEDIKNGTKKLSSVSVIWRGDSEISYDDIQELLMYIGRKCISGIKSRGESELDKMLSNPLKSSTDIDDVISKQEKLIDDIINSSNEKGKNINNN